MSEDKKTWSVKDLIERVTTDNVPVGLYLQWADWYATVPVEEIAQGFASSAA